jgi:DNA-binding CsgD family transcriptional regulator
MAERGEPLSDRELMLQLLRPANRIKIADGLSISPYTVKTHLRNIFIKLDVSTRTEATTVAIQQGVLSVETPGNGQHVSDVDSPLVIIIVTRISGG